MSALKEIFTNRFWLIPLATGFLVQLMKFMIYSLKEKRPVLSWLFSTGGMPSAHSAAVSCLSVLTGYHFGFDSAIFGITLYFSLIVMYDAAGVRRAQGEQAEVLNVILSELSKDKNLKRGRLKKLLGHSPLEVLVGAIIGIVVGVFSKMVRLI